MSIVKHVTERFVLTHPAHPSILWDLSREEAGQVARELAEALKGGGGHYAPGDKITNPEIEPEGVTVVHDGTLSLPFWMKDSQGAWHLSQDGQLPDDEEGDGWVWGQLVADFYNADRGLTVVR